MDQYAFKVAIESTATNPVTLCTKIDVCINSNLMLPIEYSEISLLIKPGGDDRSKDSTDSRKASNRGQRYMYCCVYIVDRQT